MRFGTRKIVFIVAASVVAALLLQFSLPAGGQLFGSHRPRQNAVASVSTTFEPPVVKQGMAATMIVTVHLTPGFHINSVKAGDPWIPTKLTVAPSTGLTFGVPRFPAAQSLKEAYFDKPLLVYTAAPVIRVPIHVASSAKKGAHKVSATLSYQGCNDKMCLPNASLPISANVVVQ